MKKYTIHAKVCYSSLVTLLWTQKNMLWGNVLQQRDYIQDIDTFIGYLKNGFTLDTSVFLWDLKKKNSFSPGNFTNRIIYILCSSSNFSYAPLAQSSPQTVNKMKFKQVLFHLQHCINWLLFQAAHLFSSNSKKMYEVIKSLLYQLSAGRCCSAC